MTQSIEQQKEEITTLLDKHPAGLSRSQIAEKISFSINDKTLQRRLSDLVSEGNILREGQRKSARYYPLKDTQATADQDLKDRPSVVFSAASQKKLKFLESPTIARAKVSYNSSFLDEYIPNKSQYIPNKMRDKLAQEGKRLDEPLAAGTYARQIYQRLLIDLSYHSSRLEGNTYSHLDTQKLIEEEITAEGKVYEETVMIMNHKRAISFIVENAREIEISSFTVCNLHYLLSEDLLMNSDASGRIRTIEVDIGQSTYKPLTNTRSLRDNFELILQKAKNIRNPFEQSFFLLVHLSYLQAFEDVNKRTSRLCCNMPFIKNNLCPLSFTDVTREDYTAALLTIYEKNDVGPMLELFAWAYVRSCEHYGIVKESCGEIDSFRIQYRPQRKEVMGQVIKDNLHAGEAEKRIEQYCQEHKIEEVEKFVSQALTDLSRLHEGRIMDLGVTQSQFKKWEVNRP